MPEDRSCRILIVGGGIAGLSAAYRLGQARRQGAPIDESLVEAADRVGGVIRTDRVEGCLVEAGPDSFLREKPEAAALAREFGLGDSLLGSNDSTRRTYILQKGRLQPLPDGLLLMVPTRVWPVIATPLIPWSSKLAMAREWLTGRAPGGPAPDGDESVASFIGRHFGSGMLDHITEPLLAGVYGGDSASLSVRSVLGRFRQMEEKHGSLTRAALTLRKAAAGAHPASIFMTLRDGLGSLVDGLETRIEPGRVALRQRVVRLESTPDADGGPRYRAVFKDGAVREADRVILALPAWASAALLAEIDPALSDQLARIPYSSALTVALAYDGRLRARLPRGFGFLVPRSERRSLLACTFVHAKFDHRAPADRALLRCFLGGPDGAEILNASDAEIVLKVREELRSILDIGDQPLSSRVYRWPRSMAQYTVGHADRLRAIEARLAAHPGLYLAGNAYGGIGIPDVIRSGAIAARAACAGLAVEPAVSQPLGKEAGA